MVISHFDFLFNAMLMSLYIEYPKILPFVVGIWSGNSKPLVNEYIERFVTELKEILQTEISINAHRVKVNFGTIINDTPARSLLKGEND